MSTKLRIGIITYLNVVPIYRTLRADCDCSNYEFVEGYPSALNEMLRNGSLDVSPSSSIEFLRNARDYSIIKGHSISSIGPVESILLFSRVPLKELKGKDVYVTHQSETSSALLEVILKKFEGIDCVIKVSSRPSGEALHAYSAFLSIGDEALKLSREAQDITEECPETGCNFLRFGFKQYFVYDLGELWHERTGLPFVFALWISRRDLPEHKQRLLEEFSRDLDHAKEQALNRLPELALGSTAIMPAQDIVEYWHKISYDLGKEHIEGLELFRRYLDELGLLKAS